MWRLHLVLVVGVLPILISQCSLFLLHLSCNPLVFKCVKASTTISLALTDKIATLPILVS